MIAFGDYLKVISFIACSLYLKSRDSLEIIDFCKCPQPTFSNFFRQEIHITNTVGSKLLVVGLKVANRKEPTGNMIGSHRVITSFK